MSAVVEAPLELVESVAAMRFPAKAEARLRLLMDRHTNGELTQDERDELEALVELSEAISLLRARALQALGRYSPTRDTRPGSAATGESEGAAGGALPDVRKSGLWHAKEADWIAFFAQGPDNLLDPDLYKQYREFDRLNWKAPDV